MNVKTWGPILILILAVAGGVWYIAALPSVPPSGVVDNGTPSPDTMRTYTNDGDGMSFTYPARYSLREERSISGRTTLILTDADAEIPEAGEGPPAITIDLIDAEGAVSLEAWVRSSGSSNFNLSTDGRLTTTTLAGEEAVAYTWDGLYRGESVAVIHGDRILVASVTMLSTDDPIRDDFESILASLALAD